MTKNIRVKFVITHLDGRKETTFRIVPNSFHACLAKAKSIRLSLPTIKRVQFFSDPV